MKHALVATAAAALASVAAASPQPLASIELAERYTVCPGGKTGIISPAPGDTIQVNKPFQFVFCSSIKNPANSLSIQVGMGSSVLLETNLKQTRPKLYNYSLFAFDSELGNNLFVYETRADGGKGRKTLAFYNVDITRDDTYYYNPNIGK